MADRVRKLSLGVSPLLRVTAVVIAALTVSLMVFLHGNEGMVVVLLLGMVAVGAFITACLRRGLVVDERAGTLVVWTGFIIPMTRDRYSLASITHVRLSKRIVQTGKGPRIVYPVSLARKDADEIPVWQTMDYVLSRLHSERLARVVKRDVYDESSGETIVREEKYLDEPLAQRYRRLRLTAAAPPRPQRAAAMVRSGSAPGAIVIEMPGTGFRASYLGLALLFFFPGLLFVILFAVTALPQGGITTPFLVVGGILLAATVLPAVFVVVHLSTQREVIVASASGIEVKCGSWVRRKTTRLPAAQIEEIIAPADVRAAAGTHGDFQKALAYSAGARSVLIRTDKGNTGVGRWISADEQQWLKDLLVHALVSGAPGFRA